VSPQSLAADFFLIAHDPFDDGRLAIHCCSRDENSPSIMVGHADNYRPSP